MLFVLSMQPQAKDVVHDVTGWWAQRHDSGGADGSQHGEAATSILPMMSMASS